MKRLLTVALVIVPTVSALAQELEPPKEIKALGWMVGSWSGGGKMSFGGQVTELETTMKVSFDGQFLKAVSTDKSSGFTMTKTTMTSWDAKKSQYVSYSFTNIAPTARVAHGKFESSKLTMVSDPWEAGMTAIMRETLSKISDKQCGMSLEFKNGDKWIKGVDFVLIKK